MIDLDLLHELFAVNQVCHSIEQAVQNHIMPSELVDQFVKIGDIIKINL